MRVHVKFFALFRELTGIKDEWTDVPPGTSVEQLWNRYAERTARLGGIKAAFAVNQRLAKPDLILGEGDEIGFLPPVSGGRTRKVGAQRAGTRKPRKGAKATKGKAVARAPMPSNSKQAAISRRALDLGKLVRQVEFPGAGAIVTFSGVVRDNAHGKSVGHLEYEAYPEMAEATLNEIISEIHSRWPEARVAMAHRIGRLKIGEASLIIAVAAPHRPEAYLASRYAIERIKAVLPVWKKEFSSEGDYWVEGPVAGEVPAEKAEEIARSSRPTS